MFHNIPRNQIIKNALVPICFDCIYFAKHRQNIDLSICLKYGNKNIVTGEIKYDSPVLNRSNNKLCGYKGNNFINKEEIVKNEEIKNINKSLVVIK
jgi:hypothetical protein